MHGFRIPALLYTAALAKAKSEGRTLSDVVRDGLVRYLDTHEAGTDSAK